MMGRRTEITGNSLFVLCAFEAGLTLVADFFLEILCELGLLNREFPY